MEFQAKRYKQSPFHPRIWLIAVFLFPVLLAPSFTSASGGPFPAGPTKSITQIISSTEAGLDFQLHTPAYQVDQDGRIQVDGLEQVIADPGSPALPYYSTLIALPPEANVSITVKESGLSQHQPFEVLPVPHQKLAAEPDAEGMLAANPGTITELGPLFTKDQSIYTLDAPFPKARFELSEPLYRRDLRLVELKLFPLRYNPARKTLIQASDLTVQLTFSGANLDHQELLPGSLDSQRLTQQAGILNFEQTRAWHSLPLIERNAQAIELPIGVDTFKILVDQDGIYEISGAELAAQGMILPVDPGTIQMMHDGLPVAFQFFDLNESGQFDAGDKIRFYGWAFDGSRYEQMFVNDNVFWVWAGGSATPIPVRDNEAGSGSVVTTFVDSVTRQDENDNFSGWAVKWENEPTIWHMDLITAASGTTATRTYDMTLPDPDPNGVGNSVLVELTTKLSPFAFPEPTFTTKTFLNNSLDFGEAVWTGWQNLNNIKGFPAADFKQPGDTGYPANQVQVDLSSDSANAATVQLTRITVVYSRLLKALGDQLIFSRVQGGQHEFQVSGFSNADSASIIVWDISDRRLPEQITMQVQNVQPGGSGYTYIIGRTHAPDARFIATTTNNVMLVKGLSHYVPVSLTPPSAEAQWLAITHSSLRDAADTLAAFRAADFSTWVVDVEDIVNQVGYGFNTPHTIRNFLTTALFDWTVPPNYVTLFGDATRNPLGQDCPLCSSWDKNAPTLVVTDFAFVDRWNGMVPSDFTMSLLVGDDLISDIAIGRIPANTLEEANHMVQKVILYETQRQGVLEEWQKHFLFIADNMDSGGNFCDENAQTGTFIPGPTYTQEHLCLRASTTVDTDALRALMDEQINVLGTSVVNYRGHGSTLGWAGGPPILTVDETDFWQNVGRPAFILSADCLDGYFINTYNSALGETFYRLENRGSAAHWSSSGFGYSVEHSLLHTRFYQGLFTHNLQRIGDAIDYAKLQYYLAGQYPSELISFILLGDPAMNLLGPIPNEPAQGEQTIDLTSGWNMISTHIDPTEPALEDLLPAPDFVVCKDSDGRVYLPALNINDIGDWRVRDGYQCYVPAPKSILFAGDEIIPDDMPLYLPQGWSLNAYLRKTPMSIDQALNSIVPQLILAKNNAGFVYWPAYDVNQIGSLEPGQAYQVYLSSSGTLLYPPN